MQLVLYAMDHHVESFQFEGFNNIKHQQVNWDEIEAYVQQISNQARVDVILDLVDEDLQVEYMPLLLIWEKMALQKRLAAKLKQKGAVSQKFIWTGLKRTNDDQRKEEMLLTAGVYPSKHLSKLMDSLQQANVIWGGLHSSAFLLDGLLHSQIKTNLNLKSQQLKQPVLLIARMSERHYRQCFFYQGQLRLTRIVEFDYQATDDEEKIEKLAQETKLATRFIYNQKILPLGAAFNFVIMDHVDNRYIEFYWRAFDQAGIISPKWEAESNFFDVLNLVEHISMPREDLCYGNALLAQEFQKGWKPSFFDQSYVKQVNSYRFAGLGLKLATGLVVLMLGFVGVSAGLQQHFLAKKQALLTHSEQLLVNQKHRLIDQAQGQVSAPDMKAVVEFSQQLQTLNEQQPYGYDLAGLAVFLQAHPMIKMESIQWEPVGRFDSAQLKVSMRGLIHPFTGEYEPITQALTYLETRLAAQSGITGLTVLQRPFTEDQSLSHSVQTGRQGQALPFALEWQQNQAFDIAPKRPTP